MHAHVAQAAERAGVGPQANAVRHHGAFGVTADRHAVHGDARGHVDHVRVGIVRPARPVAAAHHHQRADRAIRVERHGRRVDRPDLVLRD